MKIAVIVEAFPALSQTFILNQITGLIDRGHEVDIYAEFADDKQTIHADVEQYQLLKRTFYQPRVPQHKIQRFFKGLQLFWRYCFRDPLLLLEAINPFKYHQHAISLRILYAVIPFVNNRRTYDIIQCHFGLLGRKGMLLRQVGAINGKLLTAFHGVDISQNLQLLGHDVYNDLFSEGDLFMPACDHWRRRLVELGCNPEQIVVHRMGIDIHMFSFTPRSHPIEGPVRLITVARLTEKKGIEYSIRAVANAIAFCPNLHFTIVGDGVLRPALAALIQQLNLTSVVELVGLKNRNEIIALLNQSHLFLHPSITADNTDQEASPVAIQEAMAMGLPVISTFHGGIPELVEDGVSGFLVPERDVEALTEKLIYLLQHPERWAEMGLAGRLRIEQQHDINQLNDRLVELYQSLIRSGQECFPKEESSGNDDDLATIDAHPTPMNS